MIWYSHLLKNFPQFLVIHTVKGFGIIRAESEEELKSLLMKVKEENEKVGLKKTKIMASGPATSWEIDGETWRQCQTLFLGAPKSLQMVIAAMELKDAYYFTNKGPSSQSYGFSSSHVWM